MLLLLAAVTMLSALTAGQCTTPAADPLSTSDSTSCSTLLSCQRAACSCVGASPGTFPGCLVGAPAATSACSNCVATYFSCLVFSSKPSATPSNVTTDPACTTFNSRVYLALLASAATSSSSFNDTSLRQSCGYQSCLMANQAANATACAGTNDIDVAACTYNNLVGSTTSAPTTTSVAPAPSTASPNAVPTGVDVVFVLRLSGSSWATLLADTTTNANVVNALKTDIAKALSINSKFVAITSLTVGSLVVTSQIYSGTGKSTGTLVSSINTGLTFFSSLQAVYATVSAETIVTLGIAITATTAPTSAPPAASGTPAPGTPSPPGPTTSINSAASSGSALLIAFVAASIAYMTTALL